MRSEAAIEPAKVTDENPLAELPDSEIDAMVEAGKEVFEIHRLLTKTGNNVVGELIKSHETFYEWDHYPPGDVYDRESHSQFYYHAHAFAERFEEEHGHFHTFVRPKGMPAGMKPAKVPDFKMPDDPDDALSHLIAIAMTKEGLPYRLFSTNRWVTGEVWHSAEDVCQLIDLFEIDHTQPSWPVNRWVTAMFRLFKPQMVQLLHARDATVAAWQVQHPDRNVYEDRDLEVTSYLDVSLEDQVRAVAAEALARE